MKVTNRLIWPMRDDASSAAVSSVVVDANWSLLRNGFSRCHSSLGRGQREREEDEEERMGW